MQAGKCSFCKRKLTDPESIALGAGPECRTKLQGQMCAVDAGRAIEKSLSDYTLTTLGAHLSKLERIESRFVAGRAAVPQSLRDDLQSARAKYARRVQYLASEGILTIPDFPAAPNAPSPDAALDQPHGQAPASFPTDYELACAAVVEAEAFYLREYNDPHSTRFTEALLYLQRCRQARSAVSFALAMASDKFPVKRVEVKDGFTTLLNAPDALAQIGNEWIPDLQDYAQDAAALRAGLPVRTFDATYIRD